MSQAVSLLHTHKIHAEMASASLSLSSSSVEALSTSASLPHNHNNKLFSDNSPSSSSFASFYTVRSITTTTNKIIAAAAAPGSSQINSCFLTATSSSSSPSSSASGWRSRLAALACKPSSQEQGSHEEDASPGNHNAFHLLPHDSLSLPLQVIISLQYVHSTFFPLFHDFN